MAGGPGREGAGSGRVVSAAASGTTMLKLVIPAFRELDRLPVFLGRLLVEIERAGLPCDLLVVDDGSPAAEQEQLRAAVEAVARTTGVRVEMRLLERNHGKGHAIRSGWAGDGTYSHLAFVDADECVPAASVAGLLATALDDGGADCWIGSRQPGGRVRRKHLRGLAGRLFARYARACLRVRVADFQCGLKAVRTEAYRAVEPRLRVDGFAFDCELLAHLQLNGARIVEIAVPWDEKPGRRWPFLPVAAGMVREVWRIRRTLGKRRAG